MRTGAAMDGPLHELPPPMNQNTPGPRAPDLPRRLEAEDAAALIPQPVDDADFEVAPEMLQAWEGVDVP